MANENEKFAEENCICKTCPSFAKCKEKIAFCVNGKSKCIKERKGCLCGGCPVHKKFGFGSWYYCLNGKER